MKRTAVITLSLLLFLPALATRTDAKDDAAVPQPLTQVTYHHPGARIVNGVTTSAYPSTVALVDPFTAQEFCTGTLIGCETVLTAAHCVCDGDGFECQGDSPDLLAPDEVRIFAQHAGYFDVLSIAVPAAYEFGVTSDVAILKLSIPVDGIAPTPINTTRKPDPGTTGTIVGFGITRGDLYDSGLKRRGRVTTTSCSAVPEAAHVCWEFTAPLGAAGEDSNTCLGDSGGPLFVDFGAGDVVAGVTSGGETEDCLPHDTSWDANVFAERAWIQGQGGADLEHTSCGSLPQVGQANATVRSAEGNLSAGNTQELLTVDVPAFTSVLRIAMNGEDGDPIFPNDFDLYVKALSEPHTFDSDCASTLAGVYEICEFNNPAPGTWYILADRYSGAGAFQITSTLFKSAASPPDSCTPDATTLCIDDEPGDRRFKIQVAYATVLGGGSAGYGQAIPLASLGIARGGLFWFFDGTNPELLVKVLNGCGINGHRWVFWSAGTTVGLELNVTDTQTDKTVTYLNTDGVPAAPVTDTTAFVCD